MHHTQRLDQRLHTLRDEVRIVVSGVLETSPGALGSPVRDTLCEYPLTGKTGGKWMAPPPRSVSGCLVCAGVSCNSLGDVVASGDVTCLSVKVFFCKFPCLM